jgi:Domain of Unknown Function (DUF1080)
MKGGDMRDRPFKHLRAALLAVAAFVSVRAGAAEDAAVRLFNGTDLLGWTNVNCAPETWSVTNGMIYCTGLPTGALRTLRQYENFVLELDWMHLRSGGNSGVFIWASPIGAPGVPFLRAVEVQVLDHGYNEKGKGEWYTTHGDVFPIHGSTMAPFGRYNGMRSFPSEERSKGYGEWNHYRVACTNGVIRLSVNGKEVSGGARCNYRKGYLGLESEGAPILFKNLRITELPSGGAPVGESAPLDPGWNSLFTGLDLRGWKVSKGSEARWKVVDEQLCAVEGAPVENGFAATAGKYRDAEFIVDVAPGAGATPKLRFRGMEFPVAGGKTGDYERVVLKVKGKRVSLTRGTNMIEMEPPVHWPAKGSLELADPGGVARFRNLYVRTLSGAD